MRLPNFIVLGPPRTATTWLFRCLRDHPEVYVPNVKEVRFFDERFDEGFDWYRSFYKDVSPEVVAIGDITPGYFAHPMAPSRISKLLGHDIQLFAIQRDPIERALSHYGIIKRQGKLSVGFIEALQQEPALVENGLYAKHIRRYLDYFPSQNLHILDYQHLQSYPATYLNRILSALKVGHCNPDLVHNRVNGTRPEPYWIRLNWVATVIRLQIERSRLGREVLWRLRDAGLIHLWHLLLSNWNTNAQDQNLLQGIPKSEIYLQYFAEDSDQLVHFKHLYLS